MEEIIYSILGFLFIIGCFFVLFKVMNFIDKNSFTDLELFKWIGIILVITTIFILVIDKS